jgi:hypothetical protein
VEEFVEQYLDFWRDVADNYGCDGRAQIGLDARVPGLARTEMIMNFRKLWMALLPLSVLVANAHPGHDMMEHGAGHVASSPYHLFVLAGFAVVLFAVGQVVRSQSAKKYFRFAGAAALLVAGAVWSLGI